MDKNKIFGYLGISCRARKVVSGETAYRSVVARKAKIVFLASDASANTQKKVLNVCNQCKVPCINEFCSEEISAAIGQYNRMVIAIEDQGLATKILDCRKEV